jgi:excisionase family DNA binding protein
LLLPNESSRGGFSRFATTQSGLVIVALHSFVALFAFMSCLGPGGLNDAELARAAERCLMASLDHSRAAYITIESDSGDKAPSVKLPPQALPVIAELLGRIGEDKPVQLIPANSELTTVEAAQFLNVSRPFVVKEIDAGRLKHHKVGTHRRIAIEDLVAYKKAMREQRQTALQEMADDARELGLDNY